MQAGHQTLDVDEPVPVPVSFGFEYTTRHGQAAHGGYQTVVLEVVDQQRRGWNEGAREPGTGNKHMARPIGRGHEVAETSDRALAGVRRCTTGLLSFPIPCLRVGGGFADRFDAPPGPAALVFALATPEIRGYAPVHDAGAD